MMDDSVFHKLGILEARQQGSESVAREVKDTMQKIWDRLEDHSEALAQIQRQNDQAARALLRLDKLEREHQERCCHEPATDRQRYQNALDRSMGSFLAEVGISAMKIVGVGVAVSIFVVGLERWLNG